MVIFCVYMRERAKKSPNSDAYAQIEKKTFAREEKKFCDCSLVYTYTHTLKEITA